MSESVFLACIGSEHLTSERHEVLHRCSGGRRLVISCNRDGILKVLNEVEIAVGEFPRELVGKAPKLKWFQQLGTGAEWLMHHPEAVAHPCALTNCSDSHCVVLADHTLALILAFSRDLLKFVRAQDTGTWERTESDVMARMFELRARTLLVVGLGSIGREIVQRARSFGMKILGVRANPGRPMDGVEKIVGQGELNTMLAEADIVAVTLPLTRETRGMFDEKAFAAMKRSAFLVNVGRGAVIDETSLLSALSDGRIAGAGLDVFAEEPLPKSSPLWQAPNLIITPHVGGMHGGIFETWMEAVFDNIQRYHEGRQLRNIVNKQAGY